MQWSFGLEYNIYKCKKNIQLSLTDRSIVSIFNAKSWEKMLFQINQTKNKEYNKIVHIERSHQSIYHL